MTHYNTIHKSPSKSVRPFFLLLPTFSEHPTKSTTTKHFTYTWQRNDCNNGCLIWYSWRNNFRNSLCLKKKNIYHECIRTFFTMSSVFMRYFVHIMFVTQKYFAQKVIQKIVCSALFIQSCVCESNWKQYYLNWR